MQMGTCPVCQGSGRMPAGSQYRYSFSYDKDTNTVDCRNCGAQTMSMRPTGKVRLRPDGTPCHHSYTKYETGRCYTTYICDHCGDRYSIDSGD